MHYFVFGSNLAGRHGRGAAKFAAEFHGAEYGVGEGPTGNCYAIPTKDKNLKILPLTEIEKHIEKFLEYACLNIGKDFAVTPIGCGLAGYTRPQIMELFRRYYIPSNVLFTKEWFDSDCN